MAWVKEVHGSSYSDNVGFYNEAMRTSDNRLASQRVMNHDSIESRFNALEKSLERYQRERKHRRKRNNELPSNDVAQSSPEQEYENAMSEEYAPTTYTGKSNAAVLLELEKMTLRHQQTALLIKCATVLLVCGMGVVAVKMITDKNK